MIVVDIETSGTNFYRCGIWQIGALEFENPKNIFLEEARIDNKDDILNNPGDKKTIYEVTGLKDEDFHDPKKQSQKQLLENFFKWAESARIKNCICQNPQFDLGFINRKADEYNIKVPFHHRAFDLHSFAIFKYYQLHGEFLIEKDHSDMGLTNILKFCGMQDNRKAHNSLEDARLTAECFSRIVYGKPLLKEYSQYKLPPYLAK